MTSPPFDRSFERKEAQAQNVSIKMFLARARDSSPRSIDDRDGILRATQPRKPSFIRRFLGGPKNSSWQSTDGRDTVPRATQPRMASFKGGFSISSTGGMGKEAVERPAPRRFTNIFLKLLLVGCFAALTTFFIFAFPLLRTDLVQVVLPDQALGMWHKDATSLDYIARNKGAKSAALNESFLTFAANDPTFETDNNRAKLLLDESNFDTRSRAGRFRYPTRGHTVVEVGRSRDRRGSRFEPWLLQIQSQRYQTSWPKFRRLLQSWLRKKRYDPHVMNEMVQTLKKPMDDFYRSNFNQEANEGARYKTCAVVGNSGILLNKTYGTFIDSHDAVIRLNNAKIAPYADSVGTKTTISFLNSNVYYSCGRRLKCFCHPYGAVPIVMYVCQVQQLMDLVYCEPHQPAPVLVTDPRFDVLCARIVKWYSVKRFVEVTGNPIQMWEKEHSPKEFHYSSGFQAVMLALATCDKVDLFGFGKATDSKHHYHSNQMQELDLHDYEAEYLFYDDLVHNRTASIPYLTEGGAWIPPVDIYR